MTDREAVIHLIGGACGGTAGTALTCPLEVVKTRMQSARGMADFSGGGPSTSSAGGGGGGAAGGGGASAPSGSAPRPSPYKHILANTTFRQLAQTSRFAAGPSVASIAFFRSAAAASGGVHQHQKQQGKGGIVNRLAILRHLSSIIKNEGFTALYKGLGPNLVGVAPAKAVYFYTYSTSKRVWNDAEYFVPNSAFIHMMSAATAGFVSATAVNPVWLVKTRLQLYKGGNMTIWDMVRRVYQKDGFRGFYRGVTASYVGISETVIQFVLYEHLRGVLISANRDGNGLSDEERKNSGHHHQHSSKDSPCPDADDCMAKERMFQSRDFVNFMVAGGISKFVASVAAYPHEVVRTRLREEGSAARGFLSTLLTLYKESGTTGLYRGLSVQLMRTVPSTAITMGTYEVVVYLLHNL